MSNKLLRSGYQSDIDLFLREFDKKRVSIPESVSKEIEKHQKIAKMRDERTEQADDAIWKEF